VRGGRGGRRPCRRAHLVRVRVGVRVRVRVRVGVRVRVRVRVSPPMEKRASLQ
jgi:hypothetical protein